MSHTDPRLPAVLGTQHRFWSALRAKDAALFEQILAPDFVSRSPGQPDQDRATLIESLVGFEAAVLEVGSENLAVHFFDEIAVVTGLQSARVALPNGGVVGNDVAITNVFRLTGNGWVMVLAHPVALR